MRHHFSYALVAVWIAVAVAPWVGGLDFYMLSTESRPFSPLYDIYKPSGLVGQGMGIVGTAMLAIGVSLYVARKRVSWMQGWGKLRDWLRFHIFLCTLGPYLVVMHTTFKIGNVAAVAFWSMSVVVVSGVFGRYVYRHIPKTADGEFFTEGELISRTAEAMRRVRDLTGISQAEMDRLVATLRPGSTSGLIDGVRQALLFDIRSRKLKGVLMAELSTTGVSPTIATQAIPILVDGLRYEQRRSILGPMQRLFGYWHVFHIPLALVMLLALIIHVGVAIAFGYHWIF
jgi:hypothetical protein